MTWRRESEISSSCEGKSEEQSSPRHHQRREEISTHSFHHFEDATRCKRVSIRLIQWVARNSSGSNRCQNSQNSWTPSCPVELCSCSFICSRNDSRAVSLHNLNPLRYICSSLSNDVPIFQPFLSSHKGRHKLFNSTFIFCLDCRICLVIYGLLVSTFRNSWVFLLDSKSSCK